MPMLSPSVGCGWMVLPMSTASAPIYLVWNEIPVVLGNLVGGLAFTGLTLYTTHARTAPQRVLG